MKFSVFSHFWGGNLKKNQPAGLAHLVNVVRCCHINRIFFLQKSSFRLLWSVWASNNRSKILTSGSVEETGWCRRRGLLRFELLGQSFVVNRVIEDYSPLAPCSFTHWHSQSDSSNFILKKTSLTLTSDHRPMFIAQVAGGVGQGGSQRLPIYLESATV